MPSLNPSKRPAAQWELETVLPHVPMAGLPEDGLDCACGVYLGEPTAWT